MNAEMIQPKVKLIEIGKQNRGTWVLAAIDLLLVVALWAAVAFTPGAPKPVVVDPASQAHISAATNAQRASVHPSVAPLLNANFVGASHGAACNASPNACGDNLQVRASDPAMVCQPVSRAAQHRDGGVAYLDPCAGMH